MSTLLDRQRFYWNRTVSDFDSIYSQEKSFVGKLLDKIFRNDMYGRFDYTFRKSAPVVGKTFLDIGCGTGRYAIEFARQGASKVVGLDIAEKMIEVCKDRSQKEGLSKNMFFYHTDLLTFQEKEKYDICIGIGLFDYIQNPTPVVQKMFEYTNGCSIMSFPRFYTWRAPIRKIRLYLKKCDVYFFTKTEIEKILKNAGFKKYEIVKVGQLFCVTAFPSA
ncbi:MAG: class I SAM-dependent methyltransferase [Bacteroidota bacterium]